MPNGFTKACTPPKVGEEVKLKKRDKMKCTGCLQ